MFNGHVTRLYYGLTSGMASKQYILKVQEDKKTGSLFVKFPSKLIKQLGWNTGDSIDWSAQKDGSFILSKVNEAR